MKKIILFLISTILFTSCSVDSPISATQNFFKLVQDKNYNSACQSMVNSQLQSLDESQLQACEQYFQKDYEQMQSFTVENALPLPAEKLQALKADQGFEVYYTAKLNPEVKHEKTSVVKVGGKHVLVWEKN